MLLRKGKGTKIQSVINNRTELAGSILFYAFGHIGADYLELCVDSLALRSPRNPLCKLGRPPSCLGPLQWHSAQALWAAQRGRRYAQALLLHSSWRLVARIAAFPEALGPLASAPFLLTVCANLLLDCHSVTQGPTSARVQTNRTGTGS